jgi:hypothetical protein
LPPPANHSARAVFWLQIVSLLITGWIIWSSSLVPFGRFPAEDAAIALWFSCVALVLSGVITFLLLLAMKRITRAEALDVTLRTSAAGVWFAPAILLLGARSPLANIAALVLVVSVTRVLYSQWRMAPAPETREPNSEADLEADLTKQAAPVPVLTGALPHGFLPQDFWPAFSAAAALQAGYVFAKLARPSLSSASYALGASILTAYSIAAGAWTRDREPTLPRSVLAIFVTLMMAIIITIAGMSMYGTGGGEGSDMAGGGATHSQSKSPPPPPPPPIDRRRPQPPPIDPARLGPSVSVPGGVPGVILWPETEPVPLLVEPMPKGGLSQRARSRPFVIPFSGSYWMFRTGFVRPPANSLVQRGTPTSSSFKTVDAWPLEMEAHQRLDREIDLSCCAAIRVEILNADKHPGTVVIEMALIDHAGPPIRIGRAVVRSVPDLSQDPVKPVQETLEFSIPSYGPQFDEFDVIYHRDRNRVDRSARIAIERFVLVPR